MDVFIGEFYITFVGGSERWVTITEAIVDVIGHPIYMLDKRKTIYPWGSIISMARAL
jgi:hypothetical protein